MIEEILSHHILDHALTLRIFGLELGITVHALYMLGISAALLVLLPLVLRLKGGRIRTAADFFVAFVRDDIVLPNLGEEGKNFTPFFCTMLVFLLFANYLGLVPLSSTITANISVTLGLALVSGLLITGLSIRENGLGGFLKTFVPSGVPWPLVPIIFPLEAASLLIRVFVLAVRLFANMAAGHMVLLGLFSFIFLMGARSAAAGIAATGPVLFMTLFVSLLELLVAAIQAYVFTLLTAIFTGLQMHAH
ncbi:MAG: F0F1 ATP synthase subunit A [Elusimicrobiota bacterium]|jgi:F-type H+-transporting ATPase subunit a|nr:F0F1 ATP synthase subunit A [Elusimicrobiota bacterium]